MRVPTEKLEQDPSTSLDDRNAVIGGSYRLGKLLGAGTTGQVFEAEHIRLGTRVALKMLRADRLQDTRVVERFRREARLLAGLSAENVVRVFDCGEDPLGTPFFVMERLDGEDLRAAIERDAPLSLQRALHVGIDVCRGLAALHAIGVVHRDVKPANLFLIRDAFGKETCKILDLGIARVVAAEATSQDTPIGTLRYMAPEQLADCARVGPPADVYAIGAVLYECITGAPPHTSQNVEELMFDILNRDPKPPSLLRSGVPVGLDPLLLSALSRAPEARPTSIAELARGIQRILDGASGARQPDPQAQTLPEHVPARPRLRKLDWRLPTAGGVLVAVAAAASIGSAPAPASQREAQPPSTSAGTWAARAGSEAAPLAAPPTTKRLTHTGEGQADALRVVQTTPATIPSPGATLVARKAPAPRRKQVEPTAPATNSAPPSTFDFDTQNPYSE